MSHRRVNLWDVYSLIKETAVKEMDTHTHIWEILLANFIDVKDYDVKGYDFLRSFSESHVIVETPKLRKTRWSGIW